MKIYKERTCNVCVKTYRQIQEKQPEGSKQLSYDTCPYCRNINGRSEVVKFINSKYEDNN